MAIIEYKIKSLEEYRNHIRLYQNDKRIRLYRGQKNDYLLLPKLIRKVNEKQKVKEFFKIEKRIMSDFKNSSIICDRKIKDYNDWKILSIAQHYGLPTRLLDWSTNPLTALWFAFESEKDDDKDRIVWGLVVNKESLADVESDLPDQYSYIMAFKPLDLDPRIIAQGSWFTIQSVQIFGPGGDGIPSFDDIPALNELDEFEYSLARFILPNKIRLDILKELDVLGINYFTLFPDLSGLCKNIEWHEFE
jgi:hypothetical protein